MRTIVILSLVVIAGGILFFLAKPGYFTTQGPDHSASSVRLPGIVEGHEVIISAQTGGRIQELNADEGSWVEANSVIAVLDRDELEAQNRQQEALLSQLTAKLNQMNELVTLQQESTRDMVARATAQLEVAQSQRQQCLTELEQLRKDLERDKTLMDSDSLTRRDYERQLTLVRSGEAKLDTLDKQILAATADWNLTRSNQRQVSVAQQEVAQTEAQLKQAQAQVAQTRTRLGYTTVRAPLSGIVSLRVAARGEMVKPGDPIATIVELDDVWVRAGVEETYARGKLIGHPLTVQLASGEELHGRVISVSPAGGFATQRDINRVKRDIRTFDIKVRLPNPNHNVHPGMTAYVLFPNVRTNGSGTDRTAATAVPSRSQ